MPPDVDSIVPTPGTSVSRRASPSSSRRVSNAMAQPASGASGGFGSRRESLSMSSPSMGSSAADLQAAGEGPVRHPRPLTATELHLELEKEQEAVVNRLGRELSSLRQQTASVASTTSSTSNAIHDGPVDPTSGHLVSGPVHPTATRQHRSSSNLSNTSTSISGLNSSTVSGIAPARDAAAAPNLSARGRSSRHGSMNTRRPDITSPSMTTSAIHSDRSSVPSSIPSPAHARSPHGQSSTPATPRLEEIAHHRSELDHARRENDNLRQKIQQLERELQSLNRTSGSGPAD